MRSTEAVAVSPPALLGGVHAFCGGRMVTGTAL